MTRINVIDPATLTDEHLFAEWRELPRIFALPRDDRPTPSAYTLGQGHMRFFLPRLAWLAHRHAALTAECISRGYRLTERSPLVGIGDWTPDAAARGVNLGRLRERLRGSKRAQHYRGVVVAPTFYDEVTA